MSTGHSAFIRPHRLKQAASRSLTCHDFLGWSVAPVASDPRPSPEQPGRGGGEPGSPEVPLLRSWPPFVCGSTCPPRGPSPLLSACPPTPTRLPTFQAAHQTHGAGAGVGLSAWEPATWPCPSHLLIPGSGQDRAPAPAPPSGPRRGGGGGGPK